MAHPIPYSKRLQIISYRKQGLTYVEIGKSLGCSADGARKLWHRYERSGYEGLKTVYSNSGRRSPYESIKELVKEEKTGKQGAPYIRSVLLSLHPDEAIPHERTIQRWWAKERGKKRLSAPAAETRGVGRKKPMRFGKSTAKSM